MNDIFSAFVPTFLFNFPHHNFNGVQTSRGTYTGRNCPNKWVSICQRPSMIHNRGKPLANQWFHWRSPAVRLPVDHRTLRLSTYPFCSYDASDILQHPKLAEPRSPVRREYCLCHCDDIDHRGILSLASHQRYRWNSYTFVCFAVFPVLWYVERRGRILNSLWRGQVKTIVTVRRYHRISR